MSEKSSVPKPTDRYRFRRPSGRNIEVEFRTSPGKWRSTGTKEKEEALAFAERNLYNAGRAGRQVTFKTYSQDFFLPGKCPWLDRVDPIGTSYSTAHVERYRSILKKYLWPRFGKMMMRVISRKDIDLYFRHMKLVVANKRISKDASSATKNKNLSCLR